MLLPMQMDAGYIRNAMVLEEQSMGEIKVMSLLQRHQKEYEYAATSLSIVPQVEGHLPLPAVGLPSSH